MAKEIVLLANVNPLRPNELIPVWTSRYSGTTNEKSSWVTANEHKRTLQSLGYKTAIHEIITTIYE